MPGGTAVTGVHTGDGGGGGGGTSGLTVHSKQSFLFVSLYYLIAYS